MNMPINLSLRQTIEGMPLTFDAEAAGSLTAVIQFNITRSNDAQGGAGDELGNYYLAIAKGDCQFHVGAADTPTLTITTPADVWLKISRGELSGQDALMQGLYQASGDLSLLLNMNSLFRAAGDVSYKAPAEQRPAGPIPLPGMAWLAVAFVPWIIYWVTFDIPGVGAWVSVGLPLLLSILIVGYRQVYNKPTGMEWGGLGFFALSGGLLLLGESGFMIWGSVMSSLVMSLLWLGTILFARMPLSGEYSKWGFVRGLWGNSMFIYPNTVISLMWGWQFIAASLLGITAILLPEQATLFTVLRYLLLVPAFIFTSVIQKRAMQLRVDDYETTMGRLRFWAGMGISASSGLLLAATMPGFNMPLLGWIALVPMLMALMTAPTKQRFPLSFVFGLVWSVSVHNWYPYIFPAVLGYFLIFAVGTFYAGVLVMGLWLQDRVPGWMKLLALPVTWAAVEYVKFVAPVVEDWWFVLLAKSQWRFPPALQILSVTGFPGLSFLLMLANVALAFWLLHRFQAVAGAGSASKRIEMPPVWADIAALVVVGVVLIWGAFIISDSPDNTFTIAALTDMVDQDPNILSTSEIAPEEFGTAENSPEVSQAIFDVDAALTRSITAQQPDFIVWPENEFANAEDPHFMDQLKGLAAESGSYIVADVVWHAPTGMHDTALMVSPDGEEVGRRAKINTTDGEENVGFTPGPKEYPVFDTPHGKVGLGVCWDRHRLFITRELARSGAQIVLMTVDDDFGGTPWFPPFHASDGVFRAAENQVTFGLGTTNGLSMVIDPYGRIMAEGKANERGIIMGETFTAPGQTLYTRWGDWFGWLLVAGFVVLLGMAIRNKRD